MTLNDIGTTKYDNQGLPTGTLLKTNDIGTTKYDNQGLPSGFIGTSQIIRLLASTGCGI